MDTAMFLYHCWRSAEPTRMTEREQGQQGVFSLDSFLVSFRLGLETAARADTRDVLRESRRQVNKWNVTTRKQIQNYEFWILFRTPSTTAGVIAEICLNILFNLRF